MIKNFFNLLHKDIDGLHKAAYILGISSFLSLLLALLRDRLLAHSFGAGEILDIYYASFRIPDFIFISVASMVSISVLIPFLAKEKNEQDSKEFMNEIFSFFFLVIMSVSLLIFFVTPKLTPLIFKGFSVESLEKVILLTRIMLLSPILLGFSNFFTSIIQVQKKFFVYALSPILYNLGIIMGIIAFYPLWGIKGLAFGVILGALLHLLIQFPSIYKLGFIPRPDFVFHFHKIKKIIALSLPRTLALSSGSLVILILISMASLMKEGSITIFNFALGLQMVPLNIIGISYSIASFSTLSKFTIHQKEDFLKQITITARYIIFWTIIVSVFFIVLRDQIVKIVLGSGKFGLEDIRLTAACIAIFAISMTAQSLILFFTRGYYAMGITKRPVIINIMSSASIVIFVLLFKKLFVINSFFQENLGGILNVNNIDNLNILILPLSYSLGMIINISLLLFLFKKDFGYSLKDLGRSFFQVLIASVIIGIVTYFILGFFANFLNVNTFSGVFLQSLFAGLGGSIILIFILVLMKNREVGEILSFVRGKRK
ncbi:MAG: hypothetical protein KAR54_02145 [Candidatus Pacebacteria bacterium]|nr:hypothetical protein [Candidatus Paceibacterota bacterium]